MSAIVTFWQAIIAEIKAKIPELKEVREYRGEFDNDEKPHLALRTPGALVYVTGTDASSKMMDGRLKLHMSAYVAIVGEERRNEASFEPAIIAEKLVTIIHHNRFGGTGKSDPDNVSVLNYNSDKTLKAGLSIWGVGWEQAIALGKLHDANVPPLPSGEGTIGGVNIAFDPAERSP